MEASETITAEQARCRIRMFGDYLNGAFGIVENILCMKKFAPDAVDILYMSEIGVSRPIQDLKTNLLVLRKHQQARLSEEEQLVRDDSVLLTRGMSSCAKKSRYSLQFVRAPLRYRKCGDIICCPESMLAWNACGG
jgi:hypothetical protein